MTYHFKIYYTSFDKYKYKYFFRMLDLLACGDRSLVQTILGDSAESPLAFTYDSSAYSSTRKVLVSYVSFLVLFRKIHASNSPLPANAIEMTEMTGDELSPVLATVAIVSAGVTVGVAVGIAVGVAVGVAEGVGVTADTEMTDAAVMGSAAIRVLTLTAENT